MNILLWILLGILLLLVLLILLPLRFSLRLEGDLLELVLIIRLKLFGITVFREEIFYDGGKKAFWKKKSGEEVGQPMEMGARKALSKAVQSAIDWKRMDYSLYLGGENLYSTMQITALLEYLSVFLSHYLHVTKNIQVNSGVYMNFEFRTGVDFAALGIFHISIANIIVNLIHIKLKKGVKHHGVRQSY